MSLLLPLSESLKTEKKPLLESFVFKYRYRLDFVKAELMLAYMKKFWGEKISCQCGVLSTLILMNFHSFDCLSLLSLAFYLDLIYGKLKTKRSFSFQSEHMGSRFILGKDSLVLLYLYSEFNCICTVMLNANKTKPFSMELIAYSILKQSCRLGSLMGFNFKQA